MTDSPTKSWDEPEAGRPSEGREDYGKRSADLDLNQVVWRADEGDGDEYYSSDAKREQWPVHADHDMNGGERQPLSPVSDEFQRSPSPLPKRSLSPYVKGPLSPATRASMSPPRRRALSPVRRASISPPKRRSLSPARRASLSPDRIRDSFNADKGSPSPGRRRSPPPRRWSSSTGRGRSVSPRRYSPQGDGGRRRHRDRDRSSTRSPVGRSGRAISAHGTDLHAGRSRSRSPFTRDHRRSSRSRYSPRGRYSPRWRSPPRFHSRRGYSSRRHPWSPPPNRSTGVGKPGKNLFIAGFGFVTTERDLEKKFSRYGRVTDVRIVRDKWSGDSRGFGFLSLERDEDADAAIRALDQTEWNGRVVLVEKART